MLGKVFGVICLVACVGGFLGGNGAALGTAALDGASAAVTLTVSLCGMMGLWCGVLRVLEAAGALRCLSSMLRPFLRFFFPDAAKDASGGALDAISANIGANLLGVGNAATPMALCAMKQLQAQNPTPDYATRDMITLAVMNTASLNLIPTTILALLRKEGAQTPYRVILPIWITSFCCFLLSLLLCRLMGMAARREKRMPRA